MNYSYYLTRGMIKPVTVSRFSTGKIGLNVKVKLEKTKGIVKTKT